MILPRLWPDCELPEQQGSLSEAAHKNFLCLWPIHLMPGLHQARGGQDGGHNSAQSFLPISWDEKKIIFKHQLIDKAKRLIYLEAVSERGSMIQCMLEHQRKDHEKTNCYLFRNLNGPVKHNHYFLFFPFIFISWRLITLQYCSGFCHTLTWISHGFTCVPHPDPPSHLPLHPIPLGLPSAPALSTCLMHPTWAGDLFSHLIIYMFQCYSLRSSHPHLLHRVQKAVLYICVSFSVLHIGLLLPSF